MFQIFSVRARGKKGLHKICANLLKQTKASASRRLTYYFPPLVCTLRRAHSLCQHKPQNLLPLLLFRPLRLCVPSEQIRSARIVLLKITHAPYIAAIWVYEGLYALSNRWQCSKSPQQRIQSANRSIHKHAPTPRPKLRTRSEMSIPKTPTSAKRPAALRLTDHELASSIKAINDRLATMEQKIDQLSK